MHKEQETSSICASYSDFCSLGERSQGNREQLLLKENSRLRKEHSEISAKYISICNQLSKMQAKLADKQKKIIELDLFYKHEIEEVKKQLSTKMYQISKLSKGRARNSSLDKENIRQMANTENPSFCMENQSSLLSDLQSENVKLRYLVSEIIEICSPFLKIKENSQIVKRMGVIRKQLQQKISMDTILERSNCILQELRNKGPDQLEGQLGSLLSIIKSKRAQLMKTPLSFDYDIETESKNLEVLLTDIDIQMRLIQPLRVPNSQHRLSQHN